MNQIADRKTLTDHVGAYRTQSLYLETNRSALQPIMTLKECDWEYKGKVLPSLHLMYMEVADPTEYIFAIQVFGSWKCWCKQLENKMIMAYVEDWRDELEVKIRSGAIKAMQNTATTDGSKGTAAAKYLADKGWIKRKAGAPSKEEKAREISQNAEVANHLKEDHARVLGIVK